MPEGLYTGASEDSYRSYDQLQADKMFEGNVSVNYPDREIAELTFGELSEELKRRADLRQKVENKEHEATVEVKTDKPIGLVWWADVHAGGVHVDYDRLKWEAEEIKRNPYLKVALGGDFSDSYIWLTGAYEDIANLNEQNLFLYKLVEYIGIEKVLFAVIGNHPAWARKSGLDGYNELKKRIPLFDGIGTVDLWVNDIPYTGAIIHKAKGSSYMDPNFGGKRFLRENDGYDFVMTAHNHFPGSQTINRNNPKSEREVALLAGKTFKATDNWHDIEGYKKKSAQGLGSNGIIFDCEEKDMLVVSDFNKMLKYASR
jgi:hypothetical protein